jgi:hypothetical protein
LKRVSSTTFAGGSGLAGSELGTDGGDGSTARAYRPDAIEARSNGHLFRPPATLRRWIIVAVVMVGLLITASVMQVLGRRPGVYYVTTDVTFLLDSASSPNTLQADGSSIVGLAAAVDRMITGNHVSARLSSPDATLYGAGVRRGWSLALEDDGGQWQSNFDKPVLVVQVVDTTAARADAVLRTLLVRVARTARSLQERIGVAQAARVIAEASPSRPGVAYIPIRRTRALAALLLLGCGLTLACAAATSRWLVRRTKRVEVPIPPVVPNRSS